MLGGNCPFRRVVRIPSHTSGKRYTLVGEKRKKRKEEKSSGVLDNLAFDFFRTLRQSIVLTPPTHVPTPFGVIGLRVAQKLGRGNVDDKLVSIKQSQRRQFACSLKPRSHHRPIRGPLFCLIVFSLTCSSLTQHATFASPYLAYHR